MAAGKLTPKQEAFVREYLVDLNATQAAIRAGYSAKTAYSIGDENLKKPEIANAIKEAMDARAARTELTADYVLNGIRALVERCIQAEPVRDAEGSPTGEYKFEPAPALRGYELLGKHLGLFPNKVDVTVKDEVSAILESARRRAAQAQERAH